MAEDYLSRDRARLIIKTATIAANAAVSDELDLQGLRVVGIRMPAAWDAAAIGISEAVDDSGANSFLPVYDDGGGGVQQDIRIPVQASISVRVLDVLLSPYRVIRLRSVNLASGADVQQTAQRLVNLLCQPVGA